MRKLKLILSDFHLGKGRRLPDGTFNYLEDFRFDDPFVEFLNYHRTGEFADADVELIFNGDFFNLLQVDIHDPMPDVIDEKASRIRLDEILTGHPELFIALRNFASTPRHSIAFTLGNHDAGLLFPSVREKLQRELGERVRVYIDPYRFNGVHVEHGHQYFADNAYDKRNYFLTKNLPAPIINLPWGSFFVIHLLNRIKKERPYFDKIYPFKFYLRWALIHDTMFAIRTIGRILFYFFWLRFRKDPHRSSSLIRTFKIVLEVPLTPKLDREAKKILLSERDTQIVVFSHTHFALLRQFAPNKVYINTGLWNEQVSLEISNPGRIVRLTFAQLEYDDRGKIHPYLKEWKGTYKIIEDL